MIGIETDPWQRCADGTELHDYGPPEPATPKAVKLGNWKPHGVYIRWRTSHARMYDRRITDLKNSMVEQFIRCSTPDDFVSFTSEFGIPGASLEDSDREVPLRDLQRSCNSLKKLFDLNASGETAGAIELFNRYAKKNGPITPFLAQRAGSPTPSMLFQVKSPIGFMLMEASLAIGNATVLLTCNHCTRPFLAGALTSKRTNAFYCSNKCRVAAQRLAHQGTEEGA